MVSTPAPARPSAIRPTLIQWNGPQLLTWKGRIAELRLRLFADFPYLYVGSAAYEESYLSGFVAAPGALVIEASIAGVFAGLATSLPLTQDAFILREAGPLLVAGGLDPSTLFYVSEVLVEPQFQGQGIGKALFLAARESGRKQGLAQTCLMAITRDPADPRRPPEQPMPYPFWAHHGFRPVPGQVNFEYPTRRADGTVAMEKNPMVFWHDAPEQR